MDMDKFQAATIAELAATRYVLEQVGKFAFLAAGLRAEHVTSMRESARKKLLCESYPGLENVWSDDLGVEIAESVSAILTNIEAAVTEAYRQAQPDPTTGY
jgi:hypothetical protein